MVKIHPENKTDSPHRPYFGRSPLSTRREGPGESSTNFKNGDSVVQEYIHKKLKGFTLMEQLIAIALTSLLLLIGFTAVMNFNRLFRQIRLNAGEDRSVLLLETQLANDWQACNEARWDEQLTLKKAFSTITYQFEPEYIVRSYDMQSDTFRLSSRELNINEVSGTKGLVRTLSFQVPTTNEQYTIQLTKEYPQFKQWEARGYGD
ncbi:pilus assembly FimT family protein [Prolixibacter bellariivorans]|nr:prepilin-type N-terminal cleavage/methylation domain-containing protein [Prolixibacter bellariivorans]